MTTTELMQGNVVSYNGEPYYVMAILNFDEVIIAKDMDAEEEFMKEHYPTHNAKDIARHLKRHSAYGIITKAKKLGLRKAYRPGIKGFADIDLRDPYYR